MSELARINLKGPVYDPRSGVDGGSNKNMSDKIRQGRQDALNNSVQKAKLAHMKFQMKQETDMQKSQEFLAENASDIFNTKADALDSSTWKFTQPGAREEFYKKWKSEVGGNWAGFQAAYGAAKQSEMQAMQKNLMVGRNALNPDGTRKFRTDKAYQKHFSQMLDALPPEQRQQLLSQASPEMYSQIQKDNKVVVLPTIIFYDGGEEVERLQGDMSFTLIVTTKQLDDIIEEILGSKF